MQIKKGGCKSENVDLNSGLSTYCVLKYFYLYELYFPQKIIVMIK